MRKAPIHGACDCHVHLVGPHARFPQVERRAYTAGLATLDTLQAQSEHLGIRRYVLVQPSFYGLDNSCILAALDVLGDDGRGVVAMDLKSMDCRQIDELSRKGVCGIRTNHYSKYNPLGEDSLDSIVQRMDAELPRQGWHLEVIAPLPALLRSAETIARASIPIVIDHYGLPCDIFPDSNSGRCLLELLKLPHVWIKLSAPYRFVGDPLATQPPLQWLTAMLLVASERCVWGSDWPFAPVLESQTNVNLALPYRAIDYGDLLGNFLSALPSAGLAERILRENPIRLYGFSSIQNGGK
jgi:predicted TIM-barrel fold metal-dependent hydrolase